MIIAVDFDGVICDDVFPHMGEFDPQMCDAIMAARRAGHEIVLWTCRVDSALDDALYWCTRLGLEFDAINDNAPSNKAKYSTVYPNGTRKVYADYYIDDHGVDYSRDKALTLLKSIGEHNNGENNKR